MLRRRWPIVLFLAWTAYLWVARIDLTWTASDEAVVSKVVATVVGLGLLAAAGYGTAVLVRARRRVLDASEVGFFGWFARATFVIWALVAVQLVLDGGHGADFKVVHGLLGLLSVVLAAATLRVIRRDRVGPAAAPAPASAPDVAEAVSPGAKADR